MSYAATETDRRLGNIISIGRIVSVDPSKALARVDMDGPVTDWIPWSVARAGGDRTWWCPSIGEQAIVASPGGELGNAVIIGFLYQDAFPEPSDDPSIHLTQYEDGSIVEYNKSTKRLTVNVGSGDVLVVCSKATVQASTEVTLDTPTTFCTGNLQVAKSLTMGGAGESASITGNVSIQGSLDASGGSFTHNGVNVGSDHKHGGVLSGGSDTDVPV